MFDLRSLTLGPAFKPRMEDIATPDILVKQGAPASGLLRLVSLSASETLALENGFGADRMVNQAQRVCLIVRYQDSGGADGCGTPVYAITDAPALAAQDYALMSTLGVLINKFLGLLSQAEVDAAKNASTTTLPLSGGTESPRESEAPPSETQSPDSTPETSSSGSDSSN